MTTVQCDWIGGGYSNSLRLVREEGGEIRFTLHRDDWQNGPPSVFGQVLPQELIQAVRALKKEPGEQHQGWSVYIPLVDGKLHDWGDHPNTPDKPLKGVTLSVPNLKVANKISEAFNQVVGTNNT